MDNGVSGIDEAEILPEHGVDLIITDHHQIKEKLPRAYAILHPELDENYPFHHLSGAGVALKIAEALLQEVITRRLLCYCDAWNNWRCCTIN